MLFHSDSTAPIELMAAFPESSALNTVGSIQKLAPGYYFNWYSRKIIGFYQGWCRFNHTTKRTFLVTRFKFLSKPQLTNYPGAKFYGKQFTEGSDPGSYGSEFVLFLDLNLFWKEKESLSLYKWRWNRVELLPKFRQQVFLLLTIKDSGVMPTEEKL